MTRLGHAEARRWALAALVCAPYLLTWVSPVWLAPAHMVATGFPQYDQPYYVANGRAVFERGNGFFGPNPYDPDPHAPAIYFHWLTWIFGVLSVPLGLDPGLVYVLVGLTAAVVFSRLTLELVRRLGRDSPRTPLLFVLAMWGGGLAVVARAVQALAAGEPLLHQPNALEPHGGWWFLSWGRNVVFTTEAVYHVLVLAIFLAFQDRRWKLLLAAVAAVASTHPFTGAQVLVCVGGWLALNRIAPDTTGVPRLGWKPLATFAAICAAFGGYYFLYLPSFPQHARLAAIWALVWQESPRETLLAYLPVFTLFALAVARGKTVERSQAVLLGVFAAGSFALAHHHWLAPSHQPLHFTRGYLWLSLFLIALPFLDELLAKLRPRALGVPLLLLACADNLAFLWSAPHGEAQETAVIDSELRAIYRTIEEASLEGVLLSNDELAAYLAATYTPARPYLGHWANTPDMEMRHAQMREFFETGHADDWIEGIDLLLLRGPLPVGSAFSPVVLGERWSLYRRW